MHINDFVEYAELYRDLGWAVCTQLQNIVEFEPLEEQNTNALVYIKRFLIKLPDDLEGKDELIEEITEYLRSKGIT